MGIGLGVGINDLELIVKALRNLGIAVVNKRSDLRSLLLDLPSQRRAVGVAGAHLPLWDVLIALFGGIGGHRGKQP